MYSMIPGGKANCRTIEIWDAAFETSITTQQPDGFTESRYMTSARWGGGGEFKRRFSKLPETLRTSYKFRPYSIHYEILWGKNEIPRASKMSHWLPSLLSKHKPPRPRVEVFMAARQYFMLGWEREKGNAQIRLLNVRSH